MQEEKNLEMIKEVLQDEDFALTLAEAKTEADFSALLAEKGINLSSEEATAYFGALKKGFSNDELSAESLEDVAGGLVISGTALLIAGGVSFLAGFGYELFKKKKRR